MIEPLALPASALEAVIASAYALDVEEVTFLPLGADSTVWVYRVRCADGSARFLKIRRGPPNPIALAIPDALRRSGIPGIVAPLPAVDGALWAALGDLTLMLYPFISGASAMERSMTEVQWRFFGRTLRQIHDAVLEPDRAALLPHETFFPVWRAKLEDVRAALENFDPTDPLAGALAGLFTSQQPQIDRLIEAVSSPPEIDDRMVLCHADVHAANLMVDDAGALWIVDWDQPVLAPRERDMLFIVGSVIARTVLPHEEAWFFAGYGDVAIDGTLLAYYRADWALQDIAEYAHCAILRPDLGELTRRESLASCARQFRPGDIVELALHGRAGR